MAKLNHLIIFLFVLTFLSGCSKSVESLIEDLKSTDYQTQKKAVQELSEIGEPAVPGLIQLLDYPDETVVWAVKETLKKIGDPAVIPFLEYCQANEAHKNSYRWEDFELLCKICNEDCFDYLSEVYFETEREDWIIDFYSRMGDPSAPYLLDLLKVYSTPEAWIFDEEDKDWEIRNSLSTYDLEILINTIAPLKDTAACFELVKLLKYIDNSWHSSLFKTVQNGLAKYALECRTCEDMVLQTLENSDPFIRSSGIRVLTSTELKKYEPLFLKALNDKDVNVQIAAIMALGNIRSQKAVDKLLPFLKLYSIHSKKGEIYNWRCGITASVLGDIGDARAVNSLIRLLDSPYDDMARSSSAIALGQIGDSRALQPLINQLSDTENRYMVAISAAKALGLVGDKEAIKPLKTYMTTWKMGEAVSHALDSLGWTPTNIQDSVYYFIAKRDKAQLNSIREETLKIILVDIQSRNQRKLENALYTFIALGAEEIIPELQEIIQKKGTVRLAEAYLNCGQDDLEEAARIWAKKHGYRIYSGGGNAPTGWGAWN